MISVCIATFNGEKYIREQIDSILCQLSQTDEIIISDDGSKDNTLRIIAEIDDPRLKVFSDQKFSSIVKNFENAINHANGDYIFLADQDDVWLPNKVSVFMSFLSNYDCVISDCFVTDENLNIINNSFFKLINSSKNKFYNLIISNSYIGCCMAFRRCVLKKILPFPKNVPLHDIWIGNVASFYFKSVFINRQLIYFRRHGNNNSVSAQKSNKTLIHKLKVRAIITLNLLKLKCKITTSPYL